MPLLAYCLMEAETGVEKPAAGVAGAGIEDLLESGLRCFFARLPSRDAIARIPAVEAALAFHQALQGLFRQATLIPFRFPTLVETEEELRQHMREHAPGYCQALSRLRDMVQMEIHLRGARAPAGNQAQSGRGYLQERQKRVVVLEAAAEKFRCATRPWVVEWREQRSAEGMRCYALLRRDALGSFQEAAQTISASSPEVRLSGPWPPAAFLEVKDF